MRKIVILKIGDGKLFIRKILTIICQLFAYKYCELSMNFGANLGNYTRK